MVRRSWDKGGGEVTIPPSLLLNYQRSVDTIGWDDAILGLLKRRRGVAASSSGGGLGVPVLIVSGDSDHFVSTTGGVGPQEEYDSLFTTVSWSWGE